MIEGTVFDNFMQLRGGMDVDIDVYPRSNKYTFHKNSQYNNTIFVFHKIIKTLSNECRAIN